MNLLDKFHFKDKKTGIVTSMEICDSFSRSKIAEILGLIPTKVSQLVNDSGFITSAALPTKTSQLDNDSGFITSTAVPTKTSQLQNDSGFITSEAIPTNISAFNNDAGYITSAALPNTNFSADGGWGRQIIGGAAILGTMTASQSVVFDQVYGSDYWKDVTFNIPSKVRLGYVINAQATALASSGLINCTILYVDSSTITIRANNSVAATADVRFNITMFGGV